MAIKASQALMEVTGEDTSGDESHQEQDHHTRRSCGSLSRPAKVSLAALFLALVLLAVAAWPHSHRSASLRATATVQLSKAPESAFSGSEGILADAKAALKKIPDMSDSEKAVVKLQWEAMLTSLRDVYSQYDQGKSMILEMGRSAGDKTGDATNAGLGVLQVTLDTVQKCLDETYKVLIALKLSKTPAFLGSEKILTEAKAALKKIPDMSDSEKAHVKLQYEYTLTSLRDVYSNYDRSKSTLLEMGRSAGWKEDAIKAGLAKDQVVLDTVQKCIDETNKVLTALH